MMRPALLAVALAGALAAAGYPRKRLPRSSYGGSPQRSPRPSCAAWHPQQV